MRPATDRKILRTRLCQYLRQTRRRAGYTQDQVCTGLDWTPGKMSRIEYHHVGVELSELRALLDFYALRNPRIRAQLEAMTEEALRPPAAQGTGRSTVLLAGRGLADAGPGLTVGLVPAQRRYLRWERRASRIRQYEPMLVPDLFRTRDYAWQVIRALAQPGLAECELVPLLEEEMSRQGTVVHGDGSRPQLHVVIDEAALRRPVGNPAVVDKQLARLLRLADHDTVRLQILPLDRGAHPGLAGPFTLLDFPDIDDPPLVYLPGRPCRITTAPVEVACYDQIFTGLARWALSPPSSRTELRRMSRRGKHPGTRQQPTPPLRNAAAISPTLTANGAQFR